MQTRHDKEFACEASIKMTSAFSRLLDSVQRHGPWNTLMLARKNVAYELRWYLDRRFDRLHGTDTSDRIELTELDISGANRDQGIYYEPTSTVLFTHMMASIESALACEDFVFIDYGSGKGRTLMMASDYQFKSIIGVEFSRELHVTAEKNITIYRGKRQRCNELRAVHSDASVFEPPPGNLLVYFYNPFLGDVMSKVLDNLATVAGRTNAKVALVYFNPLSSDVVESSGLFRRRQAIALPRDYSRERQRKCVVYFSWPDGPGSVLA
jgi:hypothetical protein